MRIHPPHAPSRIHTPGLTIYTCFTPPSYPPAATRGVQRGSIRSARVVEKPRDGAQREPSRFAPVADALAGPTQVAASDCARLAPALPALGSPRPLVQRLASAAQPVAGVRALDEPPDGLLQPPAGAATSSPRGRGLALGCARREPASCWRKMSSRAFSSAMRSACSS